MHTRQGLERLAFFADAVAAIAMTLLIVPLVDLATEASETTPTAADFISHNKWALMAFAISFAVIAALWSAHHRIFEQLADYTPLVRRLTLLWAFTIAFLPLPTALASEFDTDRVTIALYIGSMAASSLVLTVTVIVIRRTPDLRRDGEPPNDRSLSRALATSGLFLVALLIGVAVPLIGFFALLLMLLVRFVEPLLYGRIAQE